MELMPAWKRWGYEEGIEEGLVKGIEEGIVKGIEKGREEERRAIGLRMLSKGAPPEEVASVLDVPVEEIMKWQRA